MPAFENKPPRPDVGWSADRAVAAIFAPKSESIAPAKLESLQPTGRILDSLVIDRPFSEEPDAEASAEAEGYDEPQREEAPPPRLRRNAATEAKAQRGSKAEESQARAVEPPPRVQAAASKRAPTASRAIVEANSKASPAKAKRPTPAPIEVKTQEPSLRTPIASVGEASAANASNASAPRKRTIMGRYVYGDEPKPGERWKHNLRRKW
jgi:hypothetical protein